MSKEKKATYIKPEKSKNNKKRKDNGVKKPNGFLLGVKETLVACVNNQAALNARKKAWCYALLMVFLGILLSLIPTSVTILKAKGSAMISEKAITNSADTGLREFSNSLSQNGISIEVKENSDQKGPKRILSISNMETWNQTYPDTLFDHHYFSFSHYDGKTSNVRLRVFFVDSSAQDTADLQKKLLSMTYSSEKDDNKENDVPISSFLILGKENAYMAIYEKAAVNGTKPKSSNSFNYDAIDVGTKIETFAQVAEGGLEEQTKASQEHWSIFFDDGYQSVKIASFWLQSALYAGIDLLIVFFMGLMIFIVTRGKKNPFRTEYHFFDSIKAACVASLAPGIITLAVGFLLPQYASMIFMLLIGMRVMWMTSKNLTPYIAAEANKK